MSKQKDRVAIVVDSAASLPQDMGEHTQLYVVPLQLTLSGRTYEDGRDLTSTDFYRMLKGMTGTPSTAAPSPARFLDVFRSATLEASSIVCVTVSPRFSSSYDSAMSAAHEARDVLPHAQIVVLDSESAAGAEGLIAMEAWRAARRGASIEEVRAAALAVVSKVSLLAFLDTLYYVWKSGRVPRVAHFGTSLLRIKPIFELLRGEIRTLARPRTAATATDRMLELMGRRIGPGPVHATVMHAHAGEAAELIRKRLDTEFRCEELFVSEFSPVMGAHTGPGLLGVAFWSEAAGGEI